MGILFGRRSRRSKRDPLKDDLTAHLELLKKQTDSGETGDLLQERVDQLNLICRALWSFLQERHQLTEEDLARRVEMLKQSGTQTCPQCNHTIHYRNRKCFYCGYERPPSGVFDKA